MNSASSIGKVCRDILFLIVHIYSQMLTISSQIIHSALEQWKNDKPTFLALRMLGNFCMLLSFQNQLFQKILSVTLSECQTVWIQIRTDIMLVLIWIQTVCKGYSQTTKVAINKERVREQWKVI